MTYVVHLFLMTIDDTLMTLFKQKDLILYFTL